MFVYLKRIIWISLVSLVLTSCNDDKKLLQDAIDAVAVKEPLKKEKVDYDLNVTDFNIGNLADNSGNLSLPNILKIKKIASYKFAKRNDKINYNFFKSYFADNILITATNYNEIVKYDLANQEILFRYEFSGEKLRNFASGGIVRVSKDIIIVVLGGNKIYALNFNDGALIWERELLSNIRSLPDFDENNIYLLSTTNQAHAIDFRSGASKWNNDFSSKLTTIFANAAPASRGNLVYFPTSLGYLFALNKDQGRQVWLEKILKPGIHKSDFTLTDIEANLFIKGNEIFISSFDDNFMSINADNGNSNWQKRVGLYRDFWVLGNYIFAISKDEEIFALDSRDGKIIWVQEFPEKKDDEICYSKPFIISDYLAFITSKGKLLLFNPKTGEMVKRKRIAANVCNDFFVEDENLFLLNKSGKLYRYGS